MNPFVVDTLLNMHYCCYTTGTFNLQLGFKGFCRQKSHFSVHQEMQISSQILDFAMFMIPNMQHFHIIFMLYSSGFLPRLWSHCDKRSMTVVIIMICQISSNFIKNQYFLHKDIFSSKRNPLEPTQRVKIIVCLLLIASYSVILLFAGCCVHCLVTVIHRLHYIV